MCRMLAYNHIKIKNSTRSKTTKFLIDIIRIESILTYSCGFGCNLGYGFFHGENVIQLVSDSARD